MTTPSIPEGFTPWNGGDNPVPGKCVEVIFRDGRKGKGEHFSACWARSKRSYHADIIAYRVVG